jgi:hypothetical protein
VTVREDMRTALGRGLNGTSIESRAGMRDRYQRECAVAALVEALVQQRQSPLGGRSGEVERVGQQRTDVGRAGGSDHESHQPGRQHQPAMPDHELGTAAHRGRC